MAIQIRRFLFLVMLMGSAALFAQSNWSSFGQDQGATRFSLSSHRSILRTSGS